MSNINVEICSYITEEWLLPWIKEGKSQSSFAIKHNIDESTVRKIKGRNEYRIPVETLNRICEAKGIKLSEFFKLAGL
ncbi:helix-turn-helix transcriptional regulator [Flagellimonas halotolerans]|uniref:Helix-turn-helix transcriptional regulator n=1 Tax=Flagellimonas halotolerans TaxID=3112164 RepID=A0ABU6IR93_9FLAO|nr:MULTISPECIES: helix-turn-helix transcriptional regulator [unclassified Allomuricauda]MEC3965636.1 helix-turn-helix transcriptional regulator [Muricauda sp. SYSU M86414]MEC4265503.1 helix-turn-helix transcriptional regulator [Muricauda sp. SYSU M84420]|tara:strand:+ start:190 stop:423 length:234 start_codon:yes stop_codon:yes gene_type:complete